MRERSHGDTSCSFLIFFVTLCRIFFKVLVMLVPLEARDFIYCKIGSYTPPPSSFKNQIIAALCWEQIPLLKGWGLLLLLLVLTLLFFLKI